MKIQCLLGVAAKSAWISMHHAGQNLGSSNGRRPGRQRADAPLLPQASLPADLSTSLAPLQHFGYRLSHAVGDGDAKHRPNTLSACTQNAPVAALATLRKHREQNVAKHLMRIGTRIQKGWTEASQATGLPLAHQGNRQTDPDWPDRDCGRSMI